MVEADTSFFSLSNWNLLLIEDTIFFQKRTSNNSKTGVYPKASINDRHPGKYDVNCHFESEKFGSVKFCANLESEFEDHPRFVEIISSTNDTLRMTGLDNVDVFESKDGKALYVFSYRSDLLPNLRVYRIQ